MRALGAAAGHLETKNIFFLPDARPPCRGWEAYAFMPVGMKVTRSLAQKRAVGLMAPDSCHAHSWL